MAKRSTRHKIGIMLWVLMFAMAGVLTLLLTRAATPYATVTPESGALSAGVSTVVSNTPDVGSYVQFGGGSGSQCPNRPALQKDILTNIGVGNGISATQDFEANSIQFAPSNPCVLYASVFERGLFKSDNGGSSWTRIGKIGPTTYLNGVQSMIRVDPFNENKIYIVMGVGSYTDNTVPSLGFWISTDGGQTLTQPQGFKNIVATLSTPNDPYSVDVNPNDFNHILVAWHNYWNYQGSNTSSGVLESTDGGNTWKVHFRPNWGAGNNAYFITPTSWLLTTQDNGLWRTTDSGTTWTKVSITSTAHGGTMYYRSPTTNRIYVGAHTGIQYSDDKGASWRLYSNSSGVAYAPFYGVYGDGVNLYGRTAYAALEWSPGTQFIKSADTVTPNFSTFTSSVPLVNGVWSASYDSANGILYFATVGSGFLALKTR